MAGWTAKEERLVRLHYPRLANGELTVEQMAAFLPGRTLHGIRARAHLLGLMGKRRAPPGPNNALPSHVQRWKDFNQASRRRILGAAS